jgi:lipase maturation factor
MADYWYSRWLFERALAAIYLVAFVAAAMQFVPLLGERGLEPIGPWVQQVPLRASPSLFYLFPRDAAFRVGAWLGVALSVLALSSLPQRAGAWAAAGVWAVLWLLYLSFVNVGQTFYGFGWETLLCEVGFFAIFAGASRTAPNLWLIWIWRWTLFRLMFGAGLIKLRGDACWLDLTCLDYYF